MSQSELNRLHKLEDLDADGVPMTAAEYEELRELLNRENAAFLAQTK